MKETETQKAIEAEQMPVLGEDKKLLPFVPMDFLSEGMAKKNHGQTLQRLKERGGLCLSEIAAIIQGTDSITTRYSQLGSLAVILKHAIAGRSKSLEEKDKEIERLKDLISTAHAVGYQSGYKSGSNHDATEFTANKSWQQFKTENQL